MSGEISPLTGALLPFDPIGFEPVTVDVRRPGPALNVNPPGFELVDVFNPVPGSMSSLLGSTRGFLPPLDLAPAAPPMLSLRQPTAGPQLDFRVPLSIFDSGPETPVPLSFGQNVLAKGFLPALDEKLASFTGLADRRSAGFDLARANANAAARDPSLSLGERFGEGVRSALLTKDRLLDRIGSGAIENAATAARMFTNPDIGEQAFKTALSIPVHPFDTFVNAGNALLAKLSSNEPAENIVPDLMPNPSSALKGLSLLSGGGLIGSVRNWGGVGPRPGIIGLSTETPDYIAMQVRNNLLNFRRAGSEEGKYIFDPEARVFVFSPGVTWHVPLRQLIDANPDTTVGGYLYIGKSREILTDQLANDYAHNWNPEAAKNLIDLFASKGIALQNRTFWSDPRILDERWIKVKP